MTTPLRHRALAAPVVEDSAVWSLVLPVEPFALAQQDLVTAARGHQAELAHAFFLDTLRAVRATPGVGLVVVVTTDPLAAAQARTLGAATTTVVPGPTTGFPAAGRLPGYRPDTALLAAAGRLAPGAPVAVLGADLPALRPDELGRALTEAAGHERAFVTDRSGSGMNLVTARRSGSTGGRSRRSPGESLHEIGLPSSAGLRLRVGSPEELSAARSVGLGPYSSAVVATWMAPAAAVGEGG